MVARKEAALGSIHREKKFLTVSLETERLFDAHVVLHRDGQYGSQREKFKEMIATYLLALSGKKTDPVAWGDIASYEVKFDGSQFTAKYIFKDPA
jgi:hypothetical protein